MSYLRALVRLLIDKGIFTHEELEETANQIDVEEFYEEFEKMMDGSEK